MTASHLTDQHLQDYLDGLLPESNPVALHLQTCPRCQKALETYRLIYAELQTDTVPDLSPNFADAVMARLPQISPDSDAEPIGRFRLRDSYVMFVAALVAIAAGIYFILPIIPGSVPAEPSFISHFSNNAYVKIVADFFANFSLSGISVIFILLSLTGIAVIDRLVARRKHSHKPVSFLI